MYFISYHTLFVLTIGNTVNNKGREGFIRFGGKTLKFRCVWDNTAKLYGDMLEFSLVYYLADDTIEIFSISSRDQFSRLLQRSKLPKQFEFKTIGEHYDAASSDFYHWTELDVGMSIVVYARNLIIIDADDMTKNFYDIYHRPLAPTVELEKPVVVFHQREVNFIMFIIHLATRKRSKYVCVHVWRAILLLKSMCIHFTNAITA